MWNARTSVEFGLFYDALGGGFKPPSDDTGRTHTLARLMTATFTKGEVQEAHSPRERRTYTPSWAPISSVVEVCNDDYIRSLTLVGPSNELKVVHAFDGAHGRIVEVHVPLITERPPVWTGPLGSSYDIVQEGIASEAQTFFNQFPALK